MADEQTNSTEQQKAGTVKNPTPDQIETRRRHALTVINTHGTLEDPVFWRDYIDHDTFDRIFSKMEEIAPTLKELKAQAKLDELRAMGVKVPANFKVQFD